MKKILHIVNGEFYAGAERVQDHFLSSELISRDFSQGVLVLKSGEFLSKSSFDKEKNKVFLVSRFDVAGDVKKAIIDFDPHIIHCHTPVGLFWAKLGLYLARKESLVVYHVHSPVLVDTSSVLKNYIKYAIEYMAFAIKKDYAIPVSESVKRKTPFLRYSKNVAVVKNGVANRDSDVDRNTFQKRELVLGFAGLIRDRKGIFDFLRLVESLQSQDISYSARIAGGFVSKEYEKEVKSFVYSRGLEKKIKFLGFCGDVFKEMEEMDVFIFPSLYGEGLPMVVLEAMSVGLPVVASNIDGLPEVIEDGKNGFLVSPGDVNGFNEVVCALAESPSLYKQISEQARVDQREDYSTEAMCRRVMELYKNVL